MKTKSIAISKDEIYFLFTQFPLEDIRNTIPKIKEITLINTANNQTITTETAIKLLGRRKFLYHAVKCIKNSSTTAHNLKNNTEIYFEYQKGQDHNETETPTSKNHSNTKR